IISTESGAGGGKETARSGRKTTCRKLQTASGTGSRPERNSRISAINSERARKRRRPKTVGRVARCAGRKSARERKTAAGTRRHAPRATNTAKQPGLESIGVRRKSPGIAGRPGGGGGEGSVAKRRVNCGDGASPTRGAAGHRNSQAPAGIRNGIDRRPQHA